jgi:hypothetical protein
MQIYVDGVLSGSGTGPTGSRTWPTVLRIGGLQPGYNYLNGALDEVRLYDRILTVGEVQALAAGLLPAPQNVAAAPGASQIALSWDAVAGATSYTVQRATSGGGPYSELSTGVSDPTYTDTGLADGETWHYQVVAKGFAGDGEVSASVFATTYTAAENWRSENFGTTANTGNAADSADPDGDGWTNEQEFISGTDPNNRASLLKIDPMQASGNDMSLTFPSVLGRTYRVERSGTLLGGSWIPVQDNIPGTGDPIQITDTGGSGHEKRFYRIVVDW